MKLNGLSEHKRLVLRLRWVTIIVTSYILLFSKTGIFSYAFVVFYILSNLLTYRLPEKYFVRNSFFYFLIIFDTLMVSLGIYLTSQFEADFYLIYFLIILFAAMARNLKVLIINTFIISGIYGWFLLRNGIDIEHLEQGILLRIPFIFIINIFYGFLIHSYEDRMKKIRKDLNEIEKSEKRYRQIVESSHDAVVVTDNKFIIEFFNLQLSKLTNYNPQELYGMDLRKLLNSPVIKEDFFSADNHKNYQPVEAVIVGKDRIRRRVEINGSRFSLGEEDDRMIFFLKDVTEREEMKERLIHSERLSAIGELVSGVAHELNNPLTSVVGYSQLLLREIGDSRFKTEIKVIVDEALRASNIIRNLLTFARKYEPKMENVDINKLIDETLLLKSYDLKVNNIEVVKDFDNGIPNILIDPNRMKQVFLNIINNAEHAIKEVHKNGRISIVTRYLSGKIKIEFSDNGQGIPSDYIGKIFEPFFTTKKEGRGTGLGLSICYGIIKEYGGHIWAESKVGEGTSILIEIPAKLADIEERVKNEARIDLNLVGKKGLLIDDELNIIDMLSRFFKLQGCYVEYAADGEKALKRLIENSFDFIVCDIKMPGIDGIEFYRMLKEKGFSEIDKIIFMTGDVMNPVTKDFLNSIKNPYLVKPFDFETLKKTLSTIFVQ